MSRWQWRLRWCRYLAHPLWVKVNGEIWCYRHGQVVGHL
jgi:hypothetical protein